MRIGGWVSFFTYEKREIRSVFLLAQERERAREREKREKETKCRIHLLEVRI